MVTKRKAVRQPTYRMIKAEVKRRHGLHVSTGEIAHMRELLGLHPRMANNRADPDKRIRPCREDRRLALAEVICRHAL